MLRTDLPKIITDTLPGPKATEIIKRRENVVPSAIRCGYPVVIDRGEGAMIEDVDGNKFLDWIGGVGVLNIGFSQPEVVEAVKAQADKYFHGMFNVVTHEGYVSLAEKLCSIAPVKGTEKKKHISQTAVQRQMRMQLRLQRVSRNGQILLYFPEHSMEEPITPWQ